MYICDRTLHTSAYQAIVRCIVEGKCGSSLQIVQLHKVAHVLHHIHALGIGAIHPESAHGAKLPRDLKKIDNLQHIYTSEFKRKGTTVLSPLLSPPCLLTENTEEFINQGVLQAPKAIKLSGLLGKVSADIL